MLKKLAGFTCVAAAMVLMAGVQIYAADEVKTMDVKVQGQNYCVACTLGKAGANSSCSTSGHRHALKVVAAEDGSGRALPNLIGKTIHYLYNTKGMEYVDGHHGEELVIAGKLYVNERVLDIAKVEPAKKKEK